MSETKVVAPKKKPGTGVVSYQDRLAAMAKASTEQEASVSSGSFISFKSGQLSYQGSPVAGNKLDVIVVDSILENCYYPGKYKEDNKAPPTCYAFGRDEAELKPHPNSSDPQHATCKGCPQNEFGTADGGDGKGKACKNTRRLAVLPAKPLTEEALKKGECAYMKLPVTSVKGWAAYVRTLSTLENIPPLACVTSVATVADPKTQFKVVFNKVSNIPQGLMNTLFVRHDEIAEGIMFPYPEPSEEFEQKKPATKKPRKF